MGEFGMNCMAIRYGDDIVVVDAGLMFPEAELLGVDIVVPDISYLLENRKHVRGIVLTHGHEDHIGALPWILSELNVPVWGTEFTLAYVEDKLDEHQLLDNSDLREIRPGERFKVGPFTIHPLQVTHSLVDCVALAIHTPLGVVLHTGDFKVDPTPTDNRLFDLHGFAEYGKEGVLALLQDSTNVERKGYTPSERAVRRKFEEVFVRTKRRLFVSCFSSSIHRIKLTVDMAREHGRKICFIGRSMENSSEIAEDLGYVQIPEGMMIHPGEMKNFPPEKVCVLISGTQGEPMSALSRAAVDNHKHAKIEKGDTVVLLSPSFRQRKGDLSHGGSSFPPRSLRDLRRRLVPADSRQRTRQPGRIETDHQSGAAQIVRPDSWRIPAAQVARRVGRLDAWLGRERDAHRKRRRARDRRARRAQSGTRQRRPRLHRFRLARRRSRRYRNQRPASPQRRRFVMPIIAINKLTGRVETSPEIVTRGFAPGENGVIERAREIVMETLDASSAEEKADYGVIKEKIRTDLKRYISRQTQRRPLIMPVILEI